MYHDDFSTLMHQPRPAREITLHVRAVEHQIAITVNQTHNGNSNSLAGVFKTLPHRVRLLLASF